MTRPYTDADIVQAAASTFDARGAIAAAREIASADCTPEGAERAMQSVLDRFSAHMNTKMDELAAQLVADLPGGRSTRRRVDARMRVIRIKARGKATLMRKKLEKLAPELVGAVVQQGAIEDEFAQLVADALEE